ncbi:PTS fructose transporter subunit IIB [Thaumasiovibrio sp. DFM-14]|uniref:PTS fructose transporter subunit IIB n=1 Tax=Thaumasiovibrio sp. DFM-14 TaxID=3384792 RepID=UPI0039A217EA
MKIVAVTACPTGIAHTYMAASKLLNAAQQLGIQMLVETQGAMGIENPLSNQDIGNADAVLIASDIEVEHRARFTGSKIHCVTIEEVLIDPVSVINRCKLQQVSVA